MFSLVVNETSPALVGCTFENGACGWEDISVGQCQWSRETNHFGIGPSTDHTLGTVAGETNMLCSAFIHHTTYDHTEAFHATALRPLTRDVSNKC